MSRPVLIATTPSAGLQPLGSVGQRSYPLITGVVSRQLSPDHAAIFTDPVAATKGDFVDWYAVAAAPAQPLTRLSPDDRATVEDTLAKLTEDIRTLGEGMTTAADAETQRLGEALINATRIPGEGAVFAVEEALPGGAASWRPLIVDWASVDASAVNKGARQLLGWAPNRKPRVAAPEPLPVVEEVAAQPTVTETPLPATPVVIAPPPPPKPPLLWPWVAGLVTTAAALTLALWFLLLPACSVVGLGWLFGCPAPHTTAAIERGDLLANLARDRAVLENRIALLERDLTSLDHLCLPDPNALLTPIPLDLPEETPEPVEVPEEQEDASLPPVEDPVVPPTTEDEEIDERLAREEATEGELDITLAWNSLGDLDLHITCPTGDLINYANRISTDCSGTLDVDMNVGSGGVPDPVEHVYFDAPLPGDYEMMVRFYNAAFFGGDQPFTVRVRFGDETEIFEGIVTPANPVWTQTYTYAP